MGKQKYFTYFSIAQAEMIKRIEIFKHPQHTFPYLYVAL